jgi:cytochrome c biogenesis protein CcmG/thiol:disulfide interchange protein DsbE
MRRFFLIPFLILCIYVSWVFLLSHCAEEGKTPSSAPDFTLESLNNQEITLSKLKGKVVLLDFWATWCAPCRESIPHLIQLHNSYKEKGLEIIGMNLDKGSLETIHQFGKSMGIPYPITIATEDVARDYGVTALPTTVLIDKTGRIRQKLLGFNSEISKQMTATVAELLSENP